MSCRNPFVDVTVCEVSSGTVDFNDSGTLGTIPAFTIDLSDASQWCVSVSPTFQIAVPPFLRDQSPADLRSYANVTVTVTITNQYGEQAYTNNSTITVESRNVATILQATQYNFATLSPTWVTPVDLKRGIYVVVTTVSVLRDALTPILSVSGTTGVVASLEKTLS
jgi:hypothetical protein